MARKPNTDLKNKVLALLAKGKTHYETSIILSESEQKKISPQMVSYYSKQSLLEKK